MLEFLLFFVWIVLFIFSRISHQISLQINQLLNSNLIEIFRILLPAFLSLISILYTKRSLDIQRDHNQKSVKPISDFTSNTSPVQIKIVLKNCGVGPLVVNSFKIFKGSTVVDSYLEILPLEQMISLKINMKGYTMKNPDTLGEGDNRVLLNIYGSENTTINKFKPYFEILRGTRAVLIYTDIYDNEFSDEYTF